VSAFICLRLNLLLTHSLLNTYSPSNETSPPCILLVMRPVDFRASRCHLSSALTIPAGEHERVCWNDNKVFLGTLNHADLEDSKGFYSVLGCSKLSSDACIVASFDKGKTAYHKLARTHHPDKSQGNEIMVAEFMEGKNVYEQQKLAFQTLGMANVYGDAFPSRVDYDRVGEDLRDQFFISFNKIYPDKSYRARAKEIMAAGARDDIYAKRAENAAKKKDTAMPLLKRLVVNWRKVGQQSMRCYVIVHRCLSAGYLVSEMARHVRLEIYSVKNDPWSGVGMGWATSGIRQLGAPS
jgi:hypothetical protein